MKDRLNFDIGEKPNGDRVHIYMNNIDAAWIAAKLIKHGIKIRWSNSYGLSKPAKRKLERLREKYE